MNLADLLVQNNTNYQTPGMGGIGVKGAGARQTKRTKTKIDRDMTMQKNGISGNAFSNQ